MADFPTGDEPKPARRQFLGATAALAVGGSAAAAEPRAADGAPDLSPLRERGGDLNQQLRRKTLKVRVDRAKANYDEPIARHPTNGDEDRYPNKIGSDTRGLPHNTRGEVDLAAWGLLRQAIDTRQQADFERVPLGGTRKLVNPLGTLAVNLEGISPPQILIPPPPVLAGAERAAEAVEAYWQSLLRDVPFHAYQADTQHPLVLAAAREIDALRGYTGPRDANGRVTPPLLFRGTARYVDRSDRSGSTPRHVVPPGVLDGPYISQFLLRDIPYGPQFIAGQLRPQKPGSDFLADPAEWLANQDGKAATRRLEFDTQVRYLQSGRDLAEYVRGGAPGFWGALQLLSTARSSNPLVVGGFGAALNPRNPYLTLKTSASAAASWGTGYIQGLLTTATSRNIRANYWQKWFVQRTLRPEAFGGLVHQRLANGVSAYPLHADALGSEAIARSFAKFGTYLLSSAYPEGAPNHSSYPGGASSNAAVGATILKAFFDENHVIADPVQPDPSDPAKLIPYVGPPLTVGGELNKLATNLGTGRNWAGIHWRSDAASSLPQAEEVGIALLRDERFTFHEAFQGFRFTRFDGSVAEI
ncbi:twin-arginine translocation pathway signal protein [Rhizobacter sp. Root1221]|uniref:twin-arginine translocation pathway signal protein n=1 Tax=Rhizobacter sp. Root1221 TaxID=1736433 RepID=UPI0006F1CC56|nr:twin-arginine translocation pathway signal protein [Rhizobacter sp. Root1221]KQV85540.1 twin-arginine translocation pathway signal protein [Rhizobacter sp. Root1221]